MYPFNSLRILDFTRPESFGTYGPAKEYASYEPVLAKLRRMPGNLLPAAYLPTAHRPSPIASCPLPFAHRQLPSTQYPVPYCPVAF